MKIISVVGARPEFIQLDLVSKELRKRHQEVLVHTGQHYDYEMSKVFFDELNIPQPEYHLGVGSASHGKQTGEMLTRFEEVLVKEKPDWVLVFGDTNSTLAGALAAVKLHIPVGHVEAGLRSFNRQMPEEINRVLTDHVSELLFCPTDTAVKNLAREGIKQGMHNVGDVMYDSALFYANFAERRSRILDSLSVMPGKYLLATVHRPNNADDPFRLKDIVSAFEKSGEIVVFPIHPRTRKAIETIGIRLNSQIRLIQPVGYLDMLVLEKNARLILSDSGGIQKQAYFFGIPCITLREETEWVETVEAGWNLLVGADPERIIAAIERFAPATERPLVFGDGNASKRIVATLETACQ